MKYLSIITLLLLGIPTLSSAQERDTIVINDGIADFHRLNVKDVEVEYVTSDHNSITIFREDCNVEPQWHCLGGTLEIERLPSNGDASIKKRDFKFFGFHYRRTYTVSAFHGKMLIRITGPKLSAIHVSGFADMTADQMYADSLATLSYDGSAQVHIGKIVAPKAYISSSGCGKIFTATECNEIAVNLEDFAQLDIKGDANKVSGVTSVQATLNLEGNYDDISCSLTDASTLNIKGEVKHRNINTTTLCKVNFSEQDKN